MTNKSLVLLAALTVCCCIISLHASPRNACSCIRTTSSPIAPRVISKIEVTPISGHCRRIEIKVTRRNGSKVCVSPESFPKLLKEMERVGCTNGTTSCVGHLLMQQWKNLSSNTVNN